MTAEKKNTLQIISTIIVSVGALLTGIVWTGGKVADVAILVNDVKITITEFKEYKKTTEKNFIELRKENISFRDSVIKHLK